VRGFLLAVVGALGLMAWWRRRRQADETPQAQLGADPAEELRARLAESRAVVDEGDPETPEPEQSPLDPESRRRDVHERARASMDELGSDT
jgi:hypothetical protein